MHLLVGSGSYAVGGGGGHGHLHGARTQTTPVTRRWRPERGLPATRNGVNAHIITGSDFFRLMEGLTGEPFDKERRSRIRRLLEPYATTTSGAEGRRSRPAC